MRTIRGLITHVEPLDCPAGYAIADCATCIFRLGSVTSIPGKGATVKCGWDEYEEQKEEEKWMNCACKKWPTCLAAMPV